MSNLSFPTEFVKIPSQGLFYRPDHPWYNKKQVEIKYMSAKEEDILSNRNYIEDGTVMDKLFESVLIEKIDPKSVLPGDKNAILISTRILGYGKDFEFDIQKGKETKNIKVDLSLLEPHPLDLDVDKDGLCSFILPTTNIPIKFKFLTIKEEEDLDAEIENLTKILKGASPSVTTELKYIIEEIDGDTNKANIKHYVDNHMLASDSRALRKYVVDNTPRVNLTQNVKGEGEVTIPITLGFFWPDLR